MLDLPSETERIGRLIDAFAARHPEWLRTVACDDPEESGAVPEVRVDPVDSEGWVTWCIKPSRISVAELISLERDAGVAIPIALKAYLLARTHLFDQLRSHTHRQLVLLADTPFQAPLSPFRSGLLAWLPLTRAGYLRFGEWGDGWGSICIDIGSATVPVDDGGVVWFDHEALVPMDEHMVADRAAVSGHAQPLYESFRQFLDDVFDSAAPA